MIDDCHYNKLFASANIGDQGNLTALSHLSGTCSGWLKAVLQSSLGLAIHRPELLLAFIFGLKSPFSQFLHFVYVLLQSIVWVIIFWNVHENLSP